MNESTKGGRNWIAEIRRLQAQIDALTTSSSSAVAWQGAHYGGSATGAGVATMPDINVGDEWWGSGAGLIIPGGGSGFTLDLTVLAPSIPGRTYSVSGFINGVALAAPDTQQGFAVYTSHTVDSSIAPFAYQPDTISLIGSTDFINQTGSLVYQGGSGSGNELALVTFFIHVTRTA